MKKEHLNPKLNLDIVGFAHNVNRSVGLPIQTLAIPDPDPALFVSGFKDANKK
jgi:hypothetical protein